MADVLLTLGTVPVRFLDGRSSLGRAEGNNASWHCQCGTELPLLGRCYFQFGHDCHTICPECGAKFRVVGNDKKRAVEVRQE